MPQPENRGLYPAGFCSLIPDDPSQSGGCIPQGLFSYIVFETIYFLFLATKLCVCVVCIICHVL